MNMIEQYEIHNLFYGGLRAFAEGDPHLRALKRLKFVHSMDWWRGIDWAKPGIFLLTGGRQIGKTTSLKLLIRQKIFEQAFQPRDIFYLPCDQMETHSRLGQVMRNFLESRKGNPFLLLVDEITYVKDWDRAVKAVADEGWFQNGFCILTGSDTLILKDAMQRFPGRRGEAEKTDFHLHPLSFREYLELVKPAGALKNAFMDYLQCGGYLRAINDRHQSGGVLPATYSVFEQWIQGDFEKRGKSVRELLGVLKMLLETTGSQVTYSSLTQRMGEISKPTFIGYCDLLERLDILFQLQAYDQNRHIGFPKKARKFHFWDPFILETVRRWLKREQVISDLELEAHKVEAVVASHFKRKGAAYYWKGAGEVDVVVLQGKNPLFVEVKWTKQVRSMDLMELKKGKNAVILTKETAGKIDHIPAIPVFQFLSED